jgi:kynureninase
VQDTQKVHSKEQIRASPLPIASGFAHFSHLSRISSGIAFLPSPAIAPDTVCEASHRRAMPLRRFLRYHAHMNRSDLENLDRADTLRLFRDRFALPGEVIYLDGNSLGAMPKATPARIRDVLETEWGNDLIRSWNSHGWIDMQARVGAKIGKLIGAGEGETIVADSTSVNIFKLLSAALQLRPDRKIILSERDNFPTDLYMAQGLIGLLDRGHALRLAAPQEFPDAIGDDVAVVMLTHANYRTGRLYDMNAVTRAAQDKGALVIWDLAHSAGAVPVDLIAAGYDFAVGCGYKFLNGGPGAPAFLSIAKRHQDAIRPALSGWFGHDAPFAFEEAYRPASGIARATVGTPPVLSLAALAVGVDLMSETSIDALHKKALRQFEVFAALMEQQLQGQGFTLASLDGPGGRGSQISYAHPNGWPIMQALIARGVIGDFRRPDILRFGFTPLYLGFTELWDAVAILRNIMETGAWDQPQFHKRAKVT